MVSTIGTELGTVFPQVLKMSLSGGLLALVVMAARLFLGHAPKSVRCVLWAMVAVRLVCPVMPKAPFSAVPRELEIGVRNWSWAYFGSTRISPEGSPEYEIAVEAGREPVSMWVDGEESRYVAAAAEDGVSPPHTVQTDLLPVLGAIWLLGCTSMTLYALAAYAGMRRRVQASLLTEDGLWECDDVASPFILGVLRPRIYAPSGLPKGARRYIAAHENAHLRRRDHWWKPLGYALLCVHWFNPVIWVSYVLLCRDIELACDEAVIRELDRDERADYSQTLLDCGRGHRTVLACPLAFGETGVKERVAAILRYRKPALLATAAAVALCGVAAACFLTDQSHDSTLILGSIQPGDVAFATIEGLDGETQGAVFGTLNADERTRLAEILDGLEDNAVTLTSRRRTDDADYLISAVVQGMNINLYHTPGQPFTLLYMSSVNTPLDESAWIFESPELEAFLAERTENFSDARSNGLTVDNGEPQDVTVWVEWDGESGEPTVPDITLPEYPDKTFRWGAESITVKDASGTTEIRGGMPFWNGYFTDLTGDGLPELCVSMSFGSGIIDERIRVYDFSGETAEAYVLEDRGYFDYALSMENGRLIVTRTRYPGSGDGPAVSGALAIEEGHLEIQPFRVRQTEMENAVTGAIADFMGSLWWTGDPFEYDYGTGAFYELGRLVVQDASQLKVLYGADTYRTFEEGFPENNGDGGWTTLYGAAMFRAYDKNLRLAGEFQTLCAVTMATQSPSMLAVWTPGDGGEYEADVLRVFPKELADRALIPSPLKAYYTKMMGTECDSRAIVAAGIAVSQWTDNSAPSHVSAEKILAGAGAKPMFDRLFAEIAASPAEASTPAAYLDAHPEEVQTLLDLREDTLYYIFLRFLNGAETGLEGLLMRHVMDRLIGGEALDAGTSYDTGQAYFDAWFRRTLEAVQEENVPSPTSTTDTIRNDAWLEQNLPFGALAVSLARQYVEIGEEQRNSLYERYHFIP